jgi:uncharacterized OsmC-like protein
MNGIINGVDVDKLAEIIRVMETDPSKASVKFQAETKWISCAYSKTKIRNFILEGDEPVSYLGSNRVPNPVETILAALGSCLSIGFAYNAAARGINLDALDISLEGDLDLRGFLGISDKVRPGYQNIKITFKVKSDASRERLEELFNHVLRTSPVLDIIRNAEPVTIVLDDGRRAD